MCGGDLCACVCACVCMCVCVYMCVPGTGTTDSHEPSSRCRKWTLGLLREQPVFSLQALLLLSCVDSDLIICVCPSDFI